LFQDRKSMKRFFQEGYAFRPYAIVALSLLIYAVIFACFQVRVGIEIASLAVIPVIVASWYFGVKGGIGTAVLSFLINSVILSRSNYRFEELLAQPGNIVGGLTLIITAILFGKVATISRERREALMLLEQYEKQRDMRTNFLEKLGRVTALVLEPDNLQATLEILTEQLAGLFHAEDGFFTLWDSERDLPIPTAAFGSLKDTYPLIRFEPGEVTLSGSLMQMERPIPVVDINDTPFIGPRAAAIFPGRSMLGIPFITQKRKLGAILLGYKERHDFIPEELFQAEIASDQVALVLSKLQLLEDERKQLRQLTALHDVALTSIQVENEDQLIERVTEIIGNNLFPDNFGIMLLNEQEEFLYPHPSYRFYRTEKLVFSEIPLGKGITGLVAQSGQPRRIDNVRVSEDYLNMDENTRSELCVPIRFKERILGVINAESTRPDAFSEEDERLLVTLAGQLATAIEQLRRAQAERRWFDQLAHASDLIYSIAHITTQIEKSLSVNEIIQALGRELEGIGLTCILAVYDSTLKSFTINYTSLKSPLLEIVETALGYPLLEYMFPHSKFESRLGTRELSQPTVLTDPVEEIKALFTQINEGGIPILLQKIGVAQDVEPMRLPLVFEENLLGILWVWGKGIARSDLPILSIFAKQISNSLERARLFEEVQSLALTDPLTGLKNRRSVFEVGRIEFSRAQRMKRPFSCMMLDLDHFKKINDQFGHQSGDQILQEFAARCLDSVRDGDLVGRYGGEEIIILLPETDRERAMRVAERLGAAVAEKTFQVLENEIFVTVSIGVAAMDENTPHFEALIARADQALYIAKHKGRNRVAVSQ
jgi:diguanylate cyclase (GGDEF)-like protein